MAKKKVAKKKAYKPPKYTYEIDTVWHGSFFPVSPSTREAFEGITSRLLVKAGKAKKRTKR